MFLIFFLLFSTFSKRILFNISVLYDHFFISFFFIISELGSEIHNGVFWQCYYCSR